MKYLFWVLAMLLAGCSVSAQTPQASVDVDRLMRDHPLYQTLAQYDRQIGVLQATLRTQFSDTPAQIDRASAAIGRDIGNTAGAMRTARQPRYDVHFGTQSDVAAPSDIAGDIARTYGGQRAEFARSAYADMAEYRTALQRQQQHAYDAFTQAVRRRTDLAHAARARELSESESNLLLELARRDAYARLAIRAKLQTLALSASARASLQTRLATLQHNEDRTVAAARRVNAQRLARYDAQLRLQEQSDLAHMAQDLQSRSGANIAARASVLRHQLASPANLALPRVANAAPSPVDMRAQYEQLLRSHTGDPDAMLAARDDLLARFRALRAADTVDTQSVRSQIASLQHDREAVRKRIVAQIIAEASRLAQQRGLRGVVQGRTVPAGTVDLTAAVASDLRSLSP